MSEILDLIAQGLGKQETRTPRWPIAWYWARRRREITCRIFWAKSQV